MFFQLMAPSSVQCVWRRQQSRSLKKWANLHPFTASYSTTRDLSFYTLYQQPQDKMIGTCTVLNMFFVLNIFCFMAVNPCHKNYCTLILYGQVQILSLMGPGKGFWLSKTVWYTMQLSFFLQCRHINSVIPGSPRRVGKSRAVSSKPQATKPATVLPKRNIAVKYYGPVFWYIHEIVGTIL